VQLYNVFTPEKDLNDFQTLYVQKLIFSVDNFKAVLYRYMVFNFAGFNLHQAIQRRKPFTEYHIRLIIYSLLRAAKVEFLSLQLDIHPYWF
jgi:hypothetical protein